jgi:hypothetical protein
MELLVETLRTTPDGITRLYAGLLAQRMLTEDPKLRRAYARPVNDLIEEERNNSIPFWCRD